MVLETVEVSPYQRWAAVRFAVSFIKLHLELILSLRFFGIVVQGRVIQRQADTSPGLACHIRARTAGQQRSFRVTHGWTEPGLSCATVGQARSETNS